MARASAVWRAAAAGALTLLGVLLTGEAMTRLSIPAIARPYVAAAADSGPFRADPDIALAYSGYAALHAAYPERLDALAAGAAAPTWLLLGNSFVQAPGMLGDSAAAALPGRRMFYLQRNEILPVRVAQAQTLLAHGLAPERIIFALLPIDMLQLGLRRLDQIGVAANGGLFTRLAPPPAPLDRLVGVSTLAMVAWVRGGRAAGDPGFSRAGIDGAPTGGMMSDTERLLRRLAAVSARYGTPVTVLLIPSYDQVVMDAGFGMQDAVGAAARRLGLDVDDVRAAFVGLEAAPTLFVPDRHFSARGNAVLLGALLDHLRAAGLPGLPLAAPR